MLSGESYAFFKVIAKNHMYYDITAVICKMKKSGILHILLKYEKCFYLIIMQKFPDSILFTARCTLDSKHRWRLFWDYLHCQSEDPIGHIEI